MGDIVDVAVGAGTFKTLVAAVKAAGLVDALKSKGPFTVFAPTDEAFAKLPKGTVESLLKDVPKLKTILTYHVIEGAVPASDVVHASRAVPGRRYRRDDLGAPVRAALRSGGHVSRPAGHAHLVPRADLLRGRRSTAALA